MSALLAAALCHAACGVMRLDGGVEAALWTGCWRR